MQKKLIKSKRSLQNEQAFLAGRASQDWMPPLKVVSVSIHCIYYISSTHKFPPQYIVFQSKFRLAKADTFRSVGQ